MIRIACLLYEGFELLDVAGPLAIFQVAGHQNKEGYVFETVAAARGPVRSMGGLELQAAASLRKARFDTLLIPGGLGARETQNTQALIPFVQRAAEEGRRIVCVSSAAFILAEAGLLKGQRVVMHWGAAPILADRYPGIDVDGAALFARNKNIWTSAGSLSGVDLALAIVEQDFGAAAAAKIAKALLVPFRRSAAQSQQTAASTDVRPDRFDEVMAWARQRLGEDLSLQRLADKAALSVRQFTRAFRLSTGESAAKYVERLRVERARALIESGASAFEEVARKCGFDNAERMRRAFVRTLGSTPRELRRLRKNRNRY
jgi:transcriptional regulator GlxA family with amidase domain